MEFPKQNFLGVYGPRGRMKTLVEIFGSSMVPGEGCADTLLVRDSGK